MAETKNNKAKASPEVVIDRATPNDATAIMNLKRRAWLYAYVNKAFDVSTDDIEKMFPAESLKAAAANWEKGIVSEVHQNERATFVARVDGQVVGFASPTLENSQKRIGQLYVSPESQGLGVGGKLLQQAVNWHSGDEDIYLHVVSYNKNAIAFYEQYGFKRTGVIFPAGFDKKHGIKLLPEIEMILPHSSEL
jgi:ribosomal protein S18 acetylase RimI-like enzyme